MRKISVRDVLVGRHATTFWPICLAISALTLEVIPGFYPNTLSLSNKEANRIIVTAIDLYVSAYLGVERRWLSAAVFLLAGALIIFGAVPGI